MTKPPEENSIGELMRALEPVFFHADATICKLQPDGADRTLGVAVAVNSSIAASLKRLADIATDFARPAVREESPRERASRREAPGIAAGMRAQGGEPMRREGAYRARVYDILRSAYPSEYRAAIATAEGVVLTHSIRDHKLASDIEFAVVSAVAQAKGMFQ